MMFIQRLTVVYCLQSWWHLDRHSGLEEAWLSKCGPDWLLDVVEYFHNYQPCLDWLLSSTTSLQSNKKALCEEDGLHPCIRTSTYSTLYKSPKGILL